MNEFNVNDEVIIVNKDSYAFNQKGTIKSLVFTKEHGYVYEVQVQYGRGTVIMDETELIHSN